MRDNDLRSDHFLDTAKYPTITFKSTHVEPAGPGKLRVDGDLTIHGVAKPVTLDIEGPSEPVKDPRGNLHMGASATTKINRMDFGVSSMPGMVGTDVAITIDVELVKPSAPSQELANISSQSPHCGTRVVAFLAHQLVVTLLLRVPGFKYAERGRNRQTETESVAGQPGESEPLVKAARRVVLCIDQHRKDAEFPRDVRINASASRTEPSPFPW
jgi:hypothetical protein